MPKTGISPSISKTFALEGVEITVTDVAVDKSFIDNVTQLTIRTPIDLYVAKTAAAATTAATGQLNSRVNIRAAAQSTLLSWAGSSLWIVNAVPGETTTPPDLIYILGEQ